jgi:hypothetical protein
MAKADFAPTTVHQQQKPKKQCFGAAQIFANKLACAVMQDFARILTAGSIKAVPHKRKLKMESKSQSFQA